MRINLRGAWTGLPILIAMGLSGGGVALWRDLRPPQAAVTCDAALQTQWRRIMARASPARKIPGRASTRSHFRP
ncbi:Type IV pilus biogenesis protein PilO [Klebsiella pneumoniae]|uniref:Type IV pilus biogenesis protein PilO n=1 Tax=Klebsiella pneumoniae TaxID=573 RepID=A0A2X3CW03_KLEPN|nr:Type IV pilus biogenesis protein PilO [Klebsiella pneumoniae]